MDAIAENDTAPQSGSDPDQASDKKPETARDSGNEQVVHSTDYNPCPQTCVSGYVTAADGIKIRFARWKTAKFPAKGTVLLLHGRSEFIEKLYETVEDLRQSGFEVLTFDWRGQGGSDRLIADRRKGYVDSFDEYVSDLDAVMTDVGLPDCKAPFFVLGHSTGGLVALLAARQFSSRIRRMVLTAPFLGFGRVKFSGPSLKRLSGTLNALGLGKSYMGGGATATATRPFAGNLVTSDTQRYERTGKLVEDFPQLAIGAPTAAWVFAACQAMERVNDPEFHSLITTPILMISAANDTVVSNYAIEELARRLRSGANHTITGAKHELLHERDLYREQLLAAFNSFVPGTDQDQ